MLEVSAPRAAFRNAGSSAAARFAVASARAPRLEKPAGDADGRPPSLSSCSVMISVRFRVAASDGCRSFRRDRHDMSSAAELADVVSEPIFDIAGSMETALHQRLDSELAGGA